MNKRRNQRHGEMMVRAVRQRRKTENRSARGKECRTISIAQTDTITYSVDRRRAQFLSLAAVTYLTATRNERLHTTSSQQAP